VGFTQSQRTGWQASRIGLGAPATNSPEERAAYREAFAGTMRLWTWNGLATHLTLFLAASALTPMFPDAALAVWWILLVPMSLFTWLLLRTERRIETHLQQRLSYDTIRMGNEAPSA
jgi:hypothetical protein